MALYGTTTFICMDGSLQQKLLFVTCFYSCERSHSPASGLWLRVRRRVNAFIHQVDVLVSQILFTHDEEVEVSVVWELPVHL